MTNSIAYALAFSKVSGLGSKKLFEYKDRLFSLERNLDAYSLLEEIQAQHKRIKKIPSKEEFNDWISDALKTIHEQEELGIYAISYVDIDYPQGFKDLSNPPLYFFYRGNKKALLQKGIAVIGTRSVTEYTEKVGYHIGSYAAKNGFSVISGLALGCDSEGHRGCLDCDGTTIAIVGNSLDQVYPKQNTSLRNEILKNSGCILSEYPIGTPFSSYHLIERDRLQSALANGVFVVATGLTGGTWHAIKTAVTLKRPLCFYDYTAIKSYNYLSDPQTFGMSKMAELGARPISNRKSYNAFLADCELNQTNRNLKISTMEMNQDSLFNQ